MRVLAFGASITQGFWDSEGGWVERLRSYYDQRQLQDLKNRNEPTIFNLGISGDTTKGVLNRFKSETTARIWPGQDIAIIFSVGTNNALIKNDGTYLSTPEEYTKDLQDLVSLAQEFTNKILLVEQPPCDENLTRPVFWADINYTNERIAMINQAIRSVAEANGLSFVQIFGTFKDKFDNGQDLFADGLHPNDQGHQLIFELVRPALDELLKA